MSAGVLPLGTYHRATALGAGTYGSVVTVYDVDGNEFALKLFDEDDSEYEGSEEESYYEDDDNSSNNDDEDPCASLLDLGALREISILRLLRHDNAHPNIISIHDVKQAHDMDAEKDGDGDVSMNFPGIAMPLFKHGTLGSIITQPLHKKTKVQIAYGLLSGIAYLHQNGIIHRDIKADNIMIEIDDEGLYNPVIIDFGLAKVIELNLFYHDKTSTSTVMASHLPEIKGEGTHSPSVGTPTYRAPECVSEQPYGLPSDMYSIGVVILELLRGSCIEAFKDKGAAKIVANILEVLPEQPFANLVRGLLQRDPSKRLTARDALHHDLFQKFDMASTIPGLNRNFASIDLEESLPLEVDELSLSVDTKAFKKRTDLIRKIAHDLDADNPMTVQAAFCYSLQLSQLDDCLDNLRESQGLIDCVVLAHKFFEEELWALKSIEELDRGVFKQCDWSLADYIDNEGTIWMLMDFCLYPRKLVQL
jgi:serine/threonine protein kinase